MNQIYSVLKQYYGYESFKKGQEDLISHILNGQDVLGIMPTGGGKSICFQIPAQILEGVTIVISPLISLMKDQVDTLNDMGIKATYINSSLSNNKLFEVIKNAKLGLYKLIYVAPERLETDSFIELLNVVNVSLLAVDEAHCVSEWGHDFRPSYTKISSIVSRMKKRPVIAAFTATATLEVKEDIMKLLKLKNPYVLTTGFNRENLYFEVAKPENKFKFLSDYIYKNKENSGIIYCSTRKTVEAVTDKLNSKGYRVTKYHAGLKEVERTKNQEDFIYDRKQIMVATNAFGMGIDKSNIRFVVHYNMPKNMESYYQEAGRAGRDGISSECLLLFSASDIITNKLLINNGSSQSDNAYKKLNEMVDYCNTDKCLRSYILNYFGEVDVNPVCDNCSNCNNHIEETDITLESQKIMSCIKRMNERFGATLVTDVLRGSNAKKIHELGLNKLSTYGIMKDYHSDSIKEIISYLVSENYLEIRGNQYPILALSNKSYDVLLRNQKVYIKRIIEKMKPEKDKMQVRQYDQKLYEQLLTLRKELSTEQGIPPFIIFSDASLQDMCRKFPVTEDKFLNVSGVGKFKLEKYGDLFIERISQYVKENEIIRNDETVEVTKKRTKKEKNEKSSSVVTYDLFNEGLSIEDIAKERGLVVITVEKHLMDCLENGLTLDFDRLIAKNVESQIMEVVNELGCSRLKPLKEALPDEVTYRDIKFTICKYNL